jgi:MFS family permease
VTQPTLSALTPAMVRAQDLARASALGQTATSVGMLVAPALGGILIGQFGLRVPLLVDAASYLALAVAGLLIRTRRGGTAARRAAVGRPTPVPWRLRSDTLLWAMIVLVGAVVAAVSAVNVADVFFIRGALHASTTAYGLISAVWSGAMMIGGWLLARRRPDDGGLGVALLVALALTCASVLVAGLMPKAGWLVPIFVLGGLGNGMLNVSSGVLIGRRVPDEVRGHAFAIFGAVVNGTNALGFLLGGVLLGVLPVRLTIVSVGIFGVLVTLAFAPLVLRAVARERALPTVSQPTPPVRVASEV